MEGLTPHDTYVINLQHQARKLTSAGLSLVTLFAAEANRLNREDEVSRLRALYFSTKQQLERLKRSEDSASYGLTQANLIFSLGGLAVNAIASASNNKKLSTISRHIAQNLANEQRPFGTVLVRIGRDGLPGDVEVISISRLARESNRQESEVIHELQGRGYLLLDKDDFSLLIDRLVDDVRAGRLSLPISSEKLYQITTSGELKLEAKKPE